jgi:hypothetical protein
MPDRDRFELVIQDAGKPGDAPTVARVRRLLKCMLRGYRLKCVSIREVKADPAGPPDRASGAILGVPMAFQETDSPGL